MQRHLATIGALDVQNWSCDRGGHVPVQRLHWRRVWTWTLLCQVPPTWHRSEAIPRSWFRSTRKLLC